MRLAELAVAVVLLGQAHTDDRSMVYGCQERGKVKGKDVWHLSSSLHCHYCTGVRLAWFTICCAGHLTASAGRERPYISFPEKHGMASW